MSKRNLVNIFLFFIIIVLVSLVIYEPGKKTAITPPKLTGLKSTDIQHIKITRTTSNTNEQKIEFVNSSDGWMMNKPHKISANNFRIESLLKLLESVSLSQNSLNGLNKKNFGLDKPLATITFNDDVSIIFGHNKSLKNHRYVQIGTTLHMIADTFYYQLSAKSESYINHKLLPKTHNILKLTLPNLVLEKKDTDWNVTPVAGEVSADSINLLISEWSLSQAYDIKVEKPEKLKNANISVLLDNNKTLYFKMGKDKETFTLKNIHSGIRYIMSTDRRDKLLKFSGVNQDDPS